MRYRLLLLLISIGLFNCFPASPARAGDLHFIQIDDSTVVNRFNPRRALGAGVDTVSPADIDKIYTPSNISQMLAAGHGPVSYRLFTELSVEAWHWNPQGQWSTSANEGYWTGSSASAGPIRVSPMYHLPHRGFTKDEGTNTEYSRLTDGDAATYWKSNPYLTSFYTGEPDSQHPQWVIIDLGEVESVDSIRIQWANPYATHYQIDYWDGEDPMNQPTTGQWRPFPTGKVSNPPDRQGVLRLTPAPLPVQFVRVLMTDSSNTCDTHDSTDRRNCVGYAINEIEIGNTQDGQFRDLIHHAPDKETQTVTYVSSVDPWHSANDALEDEVQPGLDLIFQSGLTRQLPTMIPVSLLYGTPDDAAAEIAYLKRQNDPISFVEMGEEADLQYFAPEDYGALYVQWVTALHRVDASLKLGGPVFARDDDVQTWPDAHGETSWMKRFVSYLSQHGHLQDLAFVSFEHYPFGGCETDWSVLFREPEHIEKIMKFWSQYNVPVLITEYNFSSDYSQASLDVLGAVWQAEFLGKFLTSGGAGAYYYGYDTLPLDQQNGCWGGFYMFTVDNNGQIKAKTAQFYAAQLINLEWAQPVDALHDVYPATSDVLDNDGNRLVTAYVLHRPDGQWSLLIINKDPQQAHKTTIRFKTTQAGFTGPVSLTSFGVENYRWQPNGPDGYADPNLAPSSQTIQSQSDTVFTLPKGSINILKGSH